MAEEDPPAAASELLSDLARLRSGARVARQGYWFPLVLFGLLTGVGATVLLYLRSASRVWYAYGPQTHSVLIYRAPSASVLLRSPLAGPGFYFAWYWAIALTSGFLLTVLWYRWHARRAGVETPARGYLITGVTLTVLAIILPALARGTFSIPWLGLGVINEHLAVNDVGALALLIIGVGLAVLARAERSRTLMLITVAFIAATLLDTVYPLLAAGPPLSWPAGLLRLLPAGILLVAGCGAFLAQRSGRKTA